MEPVTDTTSDDRREETIVEILQRRDGWTKEEAEEWISEAQECILEGEDPEDLLEEIGLEPDYIWEILP